MIFCWDWISKKKFKIFFSREKIVLKKIQYLIKGSEKCRLCEKLVNRINFVSHISLCKKLTRQTIKAFGLTDKLLANVKSFETHRRLLKFELLKKLNIPEKNQNQNKIGFGNFEFWNILNSSNKINRKERRSYRNIYKIHCYFKNNIKKIKADPLHLKYDSILRLAVKKVIRKIDQNIPCFQKIRNILLFVHEILNKRMKTLIERNKFVSSKEEVIKHSSTTPILPSGKTKNSFSFLKKFHSDDDVRIIQDTILDLQLSFKNSNFLSNSTLNRLSNIGSDLKALGLMKTISSDARLREEFENLIEVNFKKCYELTGKMKPSEEESDFSSSMEEDFLDFTFRNQSTIFESSTMAVIDARSHVTVNQNDEDYILKKVDGKSEKKLKVFNAEKYMSLQRGNSASVDKEGPNPLVESKEILNLEDNFNDSIQNFIEPKLENTTSLSYNVIGNQFQNKLFDTIDNEEHVQSQIISIDNLDYKGESVSNERSIRESFADIMSKHHPAEDISNKLVLIGKGLYKIEKKESEETKMKNVIEEKKLEESIFGEISEQSESKEGKTISNGSSSSDLIDEDFLPRFSTPSLLLEEEEKAPKPKFRRLQTIDPLESELKIHRNSRSIQKKKKEWLWNHTRAKIKSVAVFSQIAKKSRRKNSNIKPSGLGNFDYLEDSERLVLSDPEDYNSLSNKYLNQRTLEMSDFVFIKKLGKGSFGKVFLVKQIKTGDYYAMKIIPSKKSMKEHELNNIVNERDVFSLVQNEFCVNALGTFVYKTLVCFVIEYMPGGDLFNHAFQGEFKLQSSNISVYIAQMVLGIEALHEVGIIHRDIKPENILVDQDGNLKLTDYGLSELKDRMSEKERFRIKGSLNFMAPEIFDFGRKEISYEIDWYALGVLVFDLVKERLPFNGKTVDDLVEKIKKNEIVWDEPGEEEDYFQFSTELRSLVEGLLEKDPNKRLGKNGADEIKNHEFFKGKDGIKWNSVQDKKYYVYRPHLVFDILKYEEKKNQTKTGVKEEINMSKFVEIEFKEDLYEFHKVKNKFECLARSKFDMFKVETLVSRNRDVALAVK